MGPPGVMIDVGAHFGSALDSFAVSGWRVIAFEPDSKNRQKLARAYGDFNNVTIDDHGVSDKVQSQVPFYRSSQSSGISGLAAFDPSHRASGEIRTTTLREVTRQYSLERVDFLKIDTEGFDLFVLKGLPDSLMPRVIVCEFEDLKTKELGYTYKDLATELCRRGYTVIMSEWFPIESYGKKHKWRRAVAWPADLIEEAGWGNFIAVADPALADPILNQLNSFAP
jgi:FkbM family methyltransferase